MGRSSSRDKARLSAAKQLECQPLLVAARRTKLAAAVSEAAAECSQAALRSEIGKHGDPGVLRIAAAAGVRDEHVVATPCLLRQKPSAIGYYRMLVGISKKQFYHGAGGLGALSSMEEGGALTKKHEGLLDEACRVLNRLLAELVLSLDERFTSEDVKELPLLQFGAQLDGAYRVKIGEAAAQEVFALVGELLRKHITSASATRLELIDATGTRVVIRRATDPDIQITREDGSIRPRKIAIEIKGGKDLSNAHNRAGEAEKSHVKARIAHATDFWTIASLPKNHREEFMAQSPTTNLWFDLSEILARSGVTWDEFRRQLTSAVGVKLSRR